MVATIVRRGVWSPPFQIILICRETLSPQVLPTFYQCTFVSQDIKKRAVIREFDDYISEETKFEVYTNY